MGIYWDIFGISVSDLASLNGRFCISLPAIPAGELRGSCCRLRPRGKSATARCGGNLSLLPLRVTPLGRYLYWESESWMRQPAAARCCVNVFLVAGTIACWRFGDAVPFAKSIVKPLHA